MQDALDLNGVLAYAEKNHIVTNGSQSCFRAKLWPQPVDTRLFGYLLHPSVKHAEHARRMPRAVLGNEAGDFFKVAGNQRR